MAPDWIVTLMVEDVISGEVPVGDLCRRVIPATHQSQLYIEHENHGRAGAAFWWPYPDRHARDRLSSGMVESVSDDWAGCKQQTSLVACKTPNKLQHGSNIGQASVAYGPEMRP